MTEPPGCMAAFTSTPVEKARPGAARRTAQWMSSVSAMWRQACSHSSIIFRVKEFMASGRFNVIVAIWPEMSTMIVS